MNPLHHSATWLHESQLSPYVDAFTHHLTEGRYSSKIIGTYIGCIAHFAYWSTQCSIDIHRLDEKVIEQFLDDHLPHCNCAMLAHHDRNRHRAALGHLLGVLRAHAVIEEQAAGKTPVDEELRRFDHHMNHVRGLASRTRSHYLQVVQCLLIDKFAGNPVVISAIQPDDVRKFVISQGELCSITASISATVSALRCYFRYRITCGDLAHHLIGVTCYPANWQLASLPKTLSNTEVKRLLESLSYEGPSARRTEAIVHCALDLGLRSCEVANLGLDDIDWSAAIITLRRTKSCREDVMPLPEATGRAIAN